MDILICKILGVAFLVLGFAGMYFPGLAGTHLSPAHNLIHVATGLTSMWFGWKSSSSARKTFCIVFGSIYGMLGLVGLFAPPGHPSMPGMSYSSHMLRVIPGVLELGTNDSVLHLIVGGVFLCAGLCKNKLEAISPTGAEKISREEASIR